MNMDGFRKMLEDCSADELSELTYMINNEKSIRKEKEKVEKANMVVKAWTNYKEKIKEHPNWKEVVIKFKKYDEKDHFLNNDYTYTRVKDVFVNEDGYISFELEPIALTKRGYFPE